MFQIDKMCNVLKREGLIKGFETVKMSGKTRIQFPDGFKRTYGDKYEVLKIANNQHTILARLRSHLQHFYFFIYKLKVNAKFFI